MSAYDFVVIGSGPAGQKAAIQAAKAGHSVAIVERSRRVGGECVHRGTIPSKALRETALQLSRARNTPIAATLPAGIPLNQLLGRVDGIINAEVAVQQDQIERNGIEIVRGVARLVGPHTVCVTGPRGEESTLTADHIVVATGSSPREVANLPVDHERLLDSDSILSLPYLPQSLLVLGGGVIGMEYATIFKELGVRVTVVDRADRPLTFLDRSLSEALMDMFSWDGSRYIPNDEVVRVEGRAAGVCIELGSGRVIQSEKVLVALGRQARIRGLGLEEVGVEVTARGQIAVDNQYRTSVPSILAVGDVIGFPALATVSMEQGRRAVRYALGLPVDTSNHAFPMGIYTIPELASVGLTEEEAIQTHGAIRVGRGRFSEVARGQITGATTGFLKLVTDAAGEQILGAHAVGDGACELIHVGQIAMMGRLPASALVDNTFNYPTLHEAYRIAALALSASDALRRAA